MEFDYARCLNFATKPPGTLFLCLALEIRGPPRTCAWQLRRPTLGHEPGLSPYRRCGDGGQTAREEKSPLPCEKDWHESYENIAKDWLKGLLKDGEQGDMTNSVRNSREMKQLHRDIA